MKQRRPSCAPLARKDATNLAIDPAITAATAALTGSIVGGVASLGATMVGQQLQARRERLARELTERTALYGKFIEIAVPLFIDALDRTSADPAKLLNFYAVLARIRLTSSDKICRAAENLAQRLFKTYEQPPLDSRVAIMNETLVRTTFQPLMEFTEACRQEFEEFVPAQLEMERAFRG